MKKHTAKYFNKTSEIIKKHKPNNEVTIQFFQRKDEVMLSGIEEVLKFLEKNTNTSKYKIRHLQDKAIISSHETVLQLIGPYQEFGIYEGIIDGILSRASSLATNAMKIKKSAKDKEVIFMGDRSDLYINQSFDGKAIAHGGIDIQVTDAHVENHKGIAVGTMPHALIQMFEGDLIKALKAYSDTFPEEKLVALVDFNNDVITDSLKAFEAFGEKLSAVRVDTSPSVSDAMFKNDEEKGVSPNMILRLRKALNKAGAKEVKIIVSSGFHERKIKKFEDLNIPVNTYGVGASLLKINTTFTGDAVIINGKKIAKTGRNYQDNPKLIEYKK